MAQFIKLTRNVEYYKQYNAQQKVVLEVHSKSETPMGYIIPVHDIKRIMIHPTGDVEVLFHSGGSLVVNEYEEHITSLLF